MPKLGHFSLNVKCVPPYHRLTASTATLSMEPSLSSSSVAAATERKNYQATWAMKRFDCWSTFEGNPGKMSRCLTEPKFYNLLVFSFFLILLNGLVKIRFLSVKAVNLQQLSAIVIISFQLYFFVVGITEMAQDFVCVYILPILCESEEL